ncbi:PE-PPE domain-containing protein [Rhodococcus tukisamuensis]|uniref:PE-PPE domain-containing protein n=1 Tax=Rhodococcus tukisamuensis TaxID=168276 RepID=A0A1G7E5R5_9NOCA|nr:PE-PPE domain-containing protein [Rhodococcus tukisamuensis]SDE59011.1 PE-PPE domain-containing protein [Rhodococcus tukisamuensis]
MKQVTVLAVGGTGESHPDDRRTEVTGLLREVTAALDARFESRWVGYPASYGPVAAGGLSFRRSTEVGVRRVLDALEGADGPVMLIGYSQGCSVIREVLGHIADGRVRCDVVAAGLISDPQQPEGAVPGCHGRGVAGAGPAVPESVPVLWIGHPEDMICNASDDSLVRDIADLTRWMSLRDLRTWLAKTWELIRRNSFQNATKTRVSVRQWRTDLRRLRTAMLEVLGYLPPHLTWRGIRVANPRGGRHVAYATEPLDARGLSGCEVLAQWIQVQATFGRRPTGRASLRAA